MNPSPELTLFQAARAEAAWRAEPSALVGGEWALEPVALDPGPAHIPEHVVDHARQRAQIDGYFRTPPLFEAAALAELTARVERVVEAGLPASFALVHAPFVALFSRLWPLMDQLIGPDCRFVPDLYIFRVPAGPDHNGFAPHRDTPQMPLSEAEGDDGVPTVMTAWIALNEATPENSCIYVVPKGRDPAYSPLARRNPRAAEAHFFDGRALPARPGVVLGWGPHLLHWGSASSRWAAAPRVSIGATFVSAKTRIHDHDALPRATRLDFDARVGLIARGLLKYERARFSDSTRDHLEALEKQSPRP